MHPIALASAMSRLVAITCPHCHFKKTVARTPTTFRVCPRCKRRFPDPLAKKTRKK